MDDRRLHFHSKNQKTLKDDTYIHIEHEIENRRQQAAGENLITLREFKAQPQTPIFFFIISLKYIFGLSLNNIIDQTNKL